MRTFKILCDTMSTRGSRIWKKGEIVSESLMDFKSIDSFVAKGLIIDTNDIESSPPIVLGNVSVKFKPSWKPRLAIVTGCWKRPEIFELFANSIKKLSNDSIEIITIVAGSEGEKSKQMVEKHGFFYIEIDNDPLATKMNSTTLLAKKFGVDFVLCVGSDDIISNELLEKYAESMKNQIDYTAVLDWYFFDTTTDKFAYWGGYIDERRKGHTCGAGRMISARLMDQWNWQPWDVKHSKVLDNSMEDKLKKTPHTSEIFSLKKLNIFAFDIKSSTNMTPFELWPNTEFITSKEIIKKYKTCVE
jgi:hypothetical protein